jgi:hypothetical protein
MRPGWFVFVPARGRSGGEIAVSVQGNAADGVVALFAALFFRLRLFPLAALFVADHFAGSQSSAP